MRTTKTDPRRSAQMARVRAKDTKPELIVRRIVDEIGFKYKVHIPELPGQPDLVFERRKKIIFVHGCFWHQHKGEKCWRSRIPKTRREFWVPKLVENSRRDRRQIARLRKDGWSVLTVWECQTIVTKVPRLKKRIRKFLTG